MDLKVIKLTIPSRMKILLENFTALSVLQIVNYVLPLLTLPYLVRVLNPDKFGLIAFAQAITQYLILFTDFGFNFSAVREISINRDDITKVSEIFSTVYFIKIVLTIFSFLLLCFAVVFIPKLNSEWELYLLMFGTVVGNMLFPVWFFQGMERMKYVTALNVLSKTIFTILIFVLIRQEHDYILFPIVSFFGFFIAGLGGLWMAISRFSIQVFMPSKKSLISQFKLSYHFFASRVCLAFYTVSNTFLLGILGNNEITGFYAAAEKLVRAVESMNQPIVNALYPYISKMRDMRLCKYSVYTGLVIGCVSCLVFIAFGQQITKILYGANFEVTAGLLKLYAIDLLIVFPSGLIGLPILAAFGHIKYLNYTNLLGLIVYFFIIGGLLIFSNFNVYLLIFAIIVSEATVLVARIMGLKKYKLW